MVDIQVKNAQKFINSYNRADIPKVEEDGLTGWHLMFALTRILQAELGIGTLSDNFGPGTMSTLQSTHPNISSASSNTAIIKVIQSAFYCKGYDGSGISGIFDNKVAEESRRLKKDMGVDVVYPGDGITPKVFKSLLTMDAYVTIPGGDANVRMVQQWLNASYVGRRDFQIIPCDGYFSRDVQKALMLAIQFQIGMSDDVANGNFGPGTQNGLRNNVQVVGSSGTWVRLLTSAMILNRRPNIAFSATFSNTLATQITNFQQFVGLPQSGSGDFQTWASLLVSTGDPSRTGTAADCITEINEPRAISLKAGGYTTVGRYLSNVSNAQWNKALLPNEILVAKQHGLSIFPIYQTWGGAAAYFGYGQGQADALAAIDRLRYYGFKSNTIVYFAVDFDALDMEVTSNIIPHFKAIKETMVFNAAGYRVGIYGPRNICSRVSQAGFAEASFVSDMSIGFSGNLGFPLPDNWAFDQIMTLTVGAGSGLIEIDKNVMSGRDMGQKIFDPPRNQILVDVPFSNTYRDQLTVDLKSYLESIGVPETGTAGLPGLPTTIISTSEAIELILDNDAAITVAANVLGVPKSLVQCPILWEYRKMTLLDIAADAAVETHRDSGIGPDDSSTGVAQIFGRTAIAAHNFCIDQGIVSESKLDISDPNVIYNTWKSLQSISITINMVPKVLIHGGAKVDVQLGRQNTESDYKATLARYNGTGPDADEYGEQLIGMYRVFEKYNGFLRNL